MMRSLFVASSGMQAQQFNLDVIANNLANTNTTGFKKSRVDFQSLLYQTIRRPVSSQEGFFNPAGIEAGSGVRVVATPLDFEQGILQETSNPLDVAIEGRGYFMVQLPDGQVGYTRNGAFSLDAEGYIVTSNGYRVLSSQGNKAAVPAAGAGGKVLKYLQLETKAADVIIGEDGTIITDRGEGAGNLVLELASFANPQGLISYGSTIFLPSPASGEITLNQPAQGGQGTVFAGYLEGSNVKIVDEIVKMIIAQRAYEISSKAIQTSDEILGMTNNLKR